ncbi:MAG: hypothetical protein REI11_12395 [Patulibacter sp.]|nr:hypothetical protein [Patulibacter sp.]
MVPSTPVVTRHHPRVVAAGGAWLLAAAVVLGEALLALIGVRSLVLTAAALLAPGAALAGLLPGPVRRTPLARIAAMPALGLAATSVAMISLSRVGVPLTGVSTRVVLFALVGVGFAIPVREGRRDVDGIEDVDAAAGGGTEHVDDSTVVETRDGAVGSRRDRVPALLELVVLAAILVAATVLGWRVVGTTPVPGNDWAKYLLYADEIARHHKLLIDNPYWLGGVGVPFREDPGMPAIYGPALIMSGAPAGALAQAILGLGVALVLTTYAYARAFFGRVGGLVAAGVVALVPASQNILGWHGLANLGALVIVALVLAQLGAWLRRDLDRRGEAGLALALVATAAAHRLTSVMLLAVLGCVALGRLVIALRAGRADVAAAARSLVRIVGFGVVLGLLVALDIRTRSAGSGGTLDYTNYLSTKVDLSIVTRDLTWIAIVATALTLLVLVPLRRLPAPAWPALALGLVASVLGYVWVIHLPLYYARMVFYLPLAVGPVVGAGAAALWSAARRVGGSPRVGALGGSVVAAVLAVVLVGGAWHQASAVRRYYGFANPASLRGLDALAADLRPGEPVTTDRCWSFLSAWLLRHPTYPALANQDIGPGAELHFARIGRSILANTAHGRVIERRLGIRYALIDPTCPTTATPVQPQGAPVYASTRLAIIRLDPTTKASTSAEASATATPSP